VVDQNRSRVPGFLFLTFAFTWAAWLACSRFGTADRTGLLALGGPVFLLGVFAPSLSAMAMVARAEGRGGVSRLVSGIVRYDVDPRYYAFALGYAAAARLLAAVLQRLLTGAWPALSETPWYLLLGAVFVSTFTQAGEEVGWRAYALPRLAARLGLGGASLVLGAIWAVWHLPLFFMPGSGSDGQSFPIYLMYVTALSVAMAWLYWRTGSSLLLVMALHASANNTGQIVRVALPYAVDPFSFEGSITVWLTLAVIWAVAGVLLFRMRGAKL